MIGTERPLSPGPEQRPQQKNFSKTDNLSDSIGQDRTAVQRAAMELLSVNFSVIPAKSDKTPAIRSWKQYQQKAMSVKSVESAFRNGCSLAVICGKVSGNLECLDFDKPELYQPFLDTLEGVNSRLASSLVKRKTPSGGFHLIYRCQAPVSGNLKLAMSKDGKKTWIETRGEGGYFLSAPSADYHVLEHSLKETPTITHEERKLLHSLAQSFTDKQELIQATKKLSNQELRPGDDYNSKADESTWRGLLEPEGWTFTDKVTSGGMHLTRPGKSSGTSATLKNSCLYVFTTNAGIPTGPHDAFSVYTHLKHNGNFTTAAKELRRQGYGRTGKKTVSEHIWPEPLPLIEKIEPESYPVDALPDIVRDAVNEVHSFTKAPVPLIASSAIASMSLATQALVDVKRADKLTGPTSLFLLTIADSGERKSTCDQFFTSPIKQYQEEQAEQAKPVLKNYMADRDAWKAKHAGLINKIKQLTEKNRPTDDYENSLRELVVEEPERPKIARLLRGDETPENLAWALAHEWPSSGVISSEAGVIFGAHGMGKDSIMRNLGLLNILWDGGEHSIGRRTTDSFTLRGARLTMGLQIQETTLRSFFERSGSIARDIGFLARFLIGWPESTQGKRFFTDPPKYWPALEAFNKHITKILNKPLSYDEEGDLLPRTLSLSPDAKSKWITFHDTVEGKLGEGGELKSVRDVASKVADNAVRLAALFQILVDQSSNTISSECISAACRIVAWHLSEARRFMGELSLSEEMKKAILLNDWLLHYCCTEQQVGKISFRHVQQYGPKPLRLKAKLNAAIDVLEDLDRVIAKKEDRSNFIYVNPMLIKEVKE